MGYCQNITKVSGVATATTFKTEHPSVCMLILIFQFKVGKSNTLVLYSSKYPQKLVLCQVLLSILVQISISPPSAQSPAAPSGVIVDGVDDTSVRVSWQTVDGADRYTVTFTKTTGNSQQGLCIIDNHVARVIVDTPSTSASIGVGQMLDVGDTTMLRAYTTYSITVVAENDVTGSSEDSVTIIVTTTQKSMW